MWLITVITENGDFTERGMKKIGGFINKRFKKVLLNQITNKKLERPTSFLSLMLMSV